MFEWSLKQSGVFWWLLFLAIQQVERVFLLPEVMAVEVPSTSVFVKTFTTGFRADLITSSIAVLLVSVLAGIRRRPAEQVRQSSRKNMTRTAAAAPVPPGFCTAEAVQDLNPALTP